ncbi:thiamine diphosphokinase [Erysipelatoclostridium sp. AM42-17]|uniref:thiamine diphosphokinase n=1 Tax=Erysipelatoclostridium sp. AM42-17 TaxID=2293102 RepID=UPI000E546A4C|nr:thiamine diphosphokinase [Erysipelatoclostridium sp. AM42-17]RHS92899.1 thiamine diphosphokinase [Erysipelatoclostridium sp. AM42-17]
MKIGICGSVYDGVPFDLTISYIGVDQGTLHLVHQGIMPIMAIGDFDSLEDKKILETLKIKTLPQRKDVTDTHAAVEYALEKNYDEIQLYGVTGKRIDHFMAIIALLKQYQDKEIVVYDRYNSIKILMPGRYCINNRQYKYFSLFAFEDTYIDIENAQYPLKHYLLKNNDPLCVSNQILEGGAYIQNNCPILLIESRDK